LTVAELEREIARTEEALAACQARFGQTDAFRDAAAAKGLQEEYEGLAQRLEALEGEYFGREA
jgi:hypothetical protein